MTVGRERLLLLVVLLGGLAIRLPFIAADPRVSGDLGIIVGWAEHMASGGLAELLARTRSSSTRRWRCSSCGWAASLARRW